jgi:hypothetical protein
MVLYHGGKDPYEGPQYTTGVLGEYQAAWVSWSGTKQLKPLDKRAPGNVQGTHAYCMGSWSMTKQLKPLDKPRAPGKVQGTHAYGMG